MQFVFEVGACGVDIIEQLRKIVFRVIPIWLMLLLIAPSKWHAFKLSLEIISKVGSSVDYFLDVEGVDSCICWFQSWLANMFISIV